MVPILSLTGEQASMQRRWQRLSTGHYPILAQLVTLVQCILLFLTGLRITVTITNAHLSTSNYRAMNYNPPTQSALEDNGHSAQDLRLCPRQGLPRAVKSLSGSGRRMTPPGARVTLLRAGSVSPRDSSWRGFPGSSQGSLLALIEVIFPFLCRKPNENFDI